MKIPKLIRLWIIRLAISRVGNIVAAGIYSLSSLVFWESFMGETDREAFFEGLAASMTTLLTCLIQWLGSRWSGEATKATQTALGVVPDGIPDLVTKGAALRLVEATKTPPRSTVRHKKGSPDASVPIRPRQKPRKGAPNR